MSARAVSLRWFVAISLGFSGWRVLTTAAYLLFGPPIISNYWLTEVFFLLSKGFLGGLFWPISFLLDGWRDPFTWLCPPW